jgi:hypothetical protein
MGYTREFITPQIELVCADENLTEGDVRQWAEDRIAHVAQLQGQSYGVIIDVRAVALVSVKMMMQLVELVRRTQHSEGYIALVSSGQMTITMAEAVLRVAPKRRERLQNFEDTEQALGWLKGVLG